MLQDLFAYWIGISKSGEIPDRNDFEPGAIAAILPKVFMLDVIDGGQRFRMRLAGTYIVEMLGFDPTGKFVEEIIQGEYLDYMIQLFRRPVETRQAVFSQSDYKYPQKNYLSVSRLILPLTHGSDAVKILLVCQNFNADSILRNDAFHAVLRDVESGDAAYTMEIFDISVD